MTVDSTSGYGSGSDTRRRRVSRVGVAGHPVPVVWALLMTLAALWPLLFSRGELMLRDMVVPLQLPLSDAALGLDANAARAVPQDTALALMSTVVSASALVTALLFVAFMIGGVSAAELVRRLLGAGLPGQVAAVTITLWNPFVVERLLQGQWSLVLAAVLLPTIALTAVLGRTGWRTSSMALAALTPTGAVLGGTVAVVAARTWRDRFTAVLTAVLVSLPWLIVSIPGIPGVPASASAPTLSDPAGAGMFAARAENLVGTIGALAGLGGIWNAQVVPASREAGAAALTVVLLLALFALGFRKAWGRIDDPSITSPLGLQVLRSRRRLVVLAAVAVVVPAVLATSWGIAMVGWTLDTVPGAGLFRDTQKFVSLALPGYAILIATGAEALADRLAERRQILAGAIAVLIAVAAVPELPSDVSELQPQDRSDGWQWVTGIVAMSDGAVAALPAASYRIINDRPVYDPAVKKLPVPVIATNDLIVGDTVVAGEGSASQVQAILLEAPDDALERLADAGVEWILVQDSPGPMGESAQILNRLDLTYSDEMLALYHVPGAINAPSPADRTAAWLAFAVWAAALLTGPVVAAGSGLRAVGRQRFATTDSSSS